MSHDLIADRRVFGCKKADHCSIAQTHSIFSERGVIGEHGGDYKHCIAAMEHV